MVQIGCQQHSLEHWLSNYKKTGTESGYTDAEIGLYGGVLAAIDTYIKGKEID